MEIQLNYVDYEDPAVQSRKCLEVCCKFGKTVIIMEPVKGGNLISPPGETKKYPEALHGGSAACYAVRFAAGCPPTGFSRHASDPAAAADKYPPEPCTPAAGQFPIVKKGGKLGMSFSPLTTLVPAAKKPPFYRRNHSKNSDTGTKRTGIAPEIPDFRPALLSFRKISNSPRKFQNSSADGCRWGKPPAPRCRPRCARSCGIPRP